MSKYAEKGEKVKIIIPKKFVRVGYTLTQTVLMQTRKEEIMGRVIKALAAAGFEEYAKDYYEHIPHRVVSNMERAICAAILRKEGWGGNERKIFEEEDFKLDGVFGTVYDKKYVRTGVYSPGSSYNTIDGWDYEPTSLENVKTHCIYSLDLKDYNDDTEWMLLSDKDSSPFRILATNCQRECD